jgi:hypothetical protein
MICSKLLVTSLAGFLIFTSLPCLGVDCGSSSSAVECVTKNCTYFGIPAFNCGGCLEASQLNETECVEDTNVVYSSYTGNTYCDTDSLEYTSLCGGSDGNSTDSDGGSAFCADNMDDCFSLGCTWIGVQAYYCGACLYNEALGNSECVEATNVEVFDTNNSIAYCNETNVPTQFMTPCPMDDSDDSDSDSQICDNQYGINDCFNAQSIYNVSCLWLAINDYNCGVCSSLEYLNSVGYSLGNTCNESALISYYGMDSNIYCYNDTAQNSGYTFDCRLYGNDTDSDDDDDDYCQKYATTAESCFNVSDDCVWAEPSLNAQNENGFQNCGVCANLTQVSSLTDCVSNATIAEEYGGWYARCGSSEIMYSRFCFNDTDTDDSDDGSCYDVDSATDCTMYSIYGCLWLEFNYDGYDCGICVDYFYINQGSCVEGYEYQNGTARCSNGTITTYNNCKDNSTMTDSMKGDTTMEPEPDTTMEPEPDTTMGMTDGGDDMSTQGPDTGGDDMTTEQPDVTDTGDDTMTSTGVIVDDTEAPGTTQDKDDAGDANMCKNGVVWIGVMIISYYWTM